MARHRQTDRTRARVTRALAEDAAGPGGVFGPNDDTTIPGELVFAPQPDLAAEISVSIPRLTAAAAFAAPVTALGVAPLDQALGGLAIQSVSRIFAPSPPDVVHGITVAAADATLDNTFLIRYADAGSPTEIAAQVDSLGDVAWAEPNRWREASLVPNDPGFASQWGLSRIGCPDAWNVTTGNPAIIVAVLDTGVDLDHRELSSLLISGQDFVDFAPGIQPFPGLILEGDFTGVDAIPQDEVGHGTHVAGTICCATNNAAGVAGVAWNIRLLPVKVLARARRIANGRITGVGSSANIAAGIRWAADNGARIINMSLGGYQGTIVEREAIAYAIGRDVVVVAAMGNDNTDQPHFPSAFPNVIAVGATDRADRRAGFSNFGPNIALVAPGVDIESTYWDDTFANLQGTSMATPHVAGVAALMLSVNPNLTTDQVGDILRATAKPLRDNPADPVPNERYGSGLVQAAAAVQAAAPMPGQGPPATMQQSVAVACLPPSQPIACQPSVVTICPSQQLWCQSSAACPTNPLHGCPSTQPISCPSQQIFCQPSVVTLCPSQQIFCQPSVVTLCPSQQIFCQQSLLCPSQTVLCQPTIACQQPSLVCGLGGVGTGGPGGQGALGGQGAQWSAYDPHGYDPYGTRY